MDAIQLAGTLDNGRLHPTSGFEGRAAFGHPYGAAANDF